MKSHECIVCNRISKKYAELSRLSSGWSKKYAAELSEIFARRCQCGIDEEDLKDGA